MRSERAPEIGELHFTISRDITRKYLAFSAFSGGAEISVSTDVKENAEPHSKEG